MSRIIEDNPSLWKFVSRGESSRRYLAPAFYSHLYLERLKELIGGDDIFRIAGDGNDMNYQRAQPSF